jgi:hypothetical protein
VGGPPALCIVAGFQRIIGNQPIANSVSILSDVGVELFSLDQAVQSIVPGLETANTDATDSKAGPKLGVSNDIAVRGDTMKALKLAGSFHPREDVISKNANGIGLQPTQIIYGSKPKNGASIAVMGIVARGGSGPEHFHILSFAGGDVSLIHAL